MQRSLRDHSNNVKCKISAMSRLSFRSDRDHIEDSDEGYRTSDVCGGDCVPEPVGSDRYGARFMWACSDHDAHSITDPFADPRGNARLPVSG